MLSQVELGNPTDCSLLGSSIHGILQARILELVAMFSSRESSQPRDQNRVSCITGGFFTTEPLGKPKTWKQPKCPSTEEWIKNKWYIYSMEHYSAIKKGAKLGHLQRCGWTQRLSYRVSQKEKNKYCSLTHIFRIQKNGIDLICKVEIETQTQRTNVYTKR